jgi:hypothetical protein
MRFVVRWSLATTAPLLLMSRPPCRRLAPMALVPFHLLKFPKTTRRNLPWLFLLAGLGDARG